MTAAKWTENRIAGMLAHQLLGRSVLVVPRCSWTGHEADLLVVHPSLRLIDVEIKVSRADLKADRQKDKWWHRRPWARRHQVAEPRRWPDKVWKHYYALPYEIWADGLLEAVPEASGVLLLHEPGKGHPREWLHVKRPAKPCRDAKPIAAADAVDLARLASLRMWAALEAKEQRK